MEEKLIIKNFGPLKSIDIAIKKVNILIGNQGTGKSTIAKVLSFVKDVSFIIYPNTQNSFIFYYLTAYIQPETQILFISKNYSINYTNQNGFKITYSDHLKSLVELYKKEMESSGENPNSKQLLLSDILNNIQGLTGGSWYIPAERQKIITGYPNVVVQSNNYLSRFSQNYSNLRQLYTSFSIPFLDIVYSYKNNRESFIKNNIELSVIESATGFQNILPIILFSQQFSPVGVGTGYLVVEEPELSLFPNTQRDLINYLVGKIYTLNDFLFLTTHSPYILSSLNNLIYAYKVGAVNALKANGIIDKAFWLNPKDIGAYILNINGEAEDLMDYEIDQLKIERIDEISREINKEYDQLLKIEFNKS